MSGLTERAQVAPRIGVHRDRAVLPAFEVLLARNDRCRFAPERQIEHVTAAFRAQAHAIARPGPAARSGHERLAPRAMERGELLLAEPLAPFQDLPGSRI